MPRKVTFYLSVLPDDPATSHVVFPDGQLHAHQVFSRLDEAKVCVLEGINTPTERQLEQVQELELTALALNTHTVFAYARGMERHALSMRMHGQLVLSLQAARSVLQQREHA